MTASAAIGALAEPREIKELAPAVRPARGLDDWAALAIGLVEPAKAGVGVGLHQSGIARQTARTAALLARSRPAQSLACRC